ncbi:MAG TPA: type II toxin-antitoxin system HicB family antitoxin [Rhizomicrobium sp.]|nr:type II toxin-antitoxin system HicB family antitoxin [Rhizomicrobium sp.]
MQRFYTAIVETARDGFGVFFPDLPGCTSFGRTVEEAAGNAYSAAQAHVALSQEYGDTIPDARAPDAIPRERDVKEKARLLIPVEMADEPVRVNISLPGSALEALDRTAKELSLSRSGAIAYLALEREVKNERFGRSHTKPNRKRTKAG